jgi:hypothetical protein
MDYTEEQQKDFLGRAGEFQKEFAEMYATLSTKHQCEMKYSIESVLIAPGIWGQKVNEQVGDLKFLPPQPTAPVPAAGAPVLE